MSTTRRTFLQLLASAPLLGRAFAPTKQQQPVPTEAAQTASESVYGFDEGLRLRDLYGEQVFIAGEKIERGDFVALDSWPRTDAAQSTYFHVVRATMDDRPVGIAVCPIECGAEAQDSILIRGRC